MTTFSKLVETFLPTSYTKVGCLCKFFEFFSYLSIFLQLCFTNPTKNYNNRKTWSENRTDAQNIIVWLHKHPIKISNDFDKVVVYILYKHEQLSLSDKAICETCIPL